MPRPPQFPPEDPPLALPTQAEPASLAALLPIPRAGLSVAGAGRSGSGSTGDGSGLGSGSGSGSGGGIGPVLDGSKLAVDVWIRPEYPEEARASNVQGAVVVLLELDETGRVKDWTFRSGPPVFYPSIRRVLPHMRFAPIQRIGHDTAIRVSFTFRFEMV